MASRRIIDIYINVQTSLEVDSTGRPVASPTRLFRGEQALLRLHLVDSANNAFPLDSNLSFLLGLDSVFTPAHADLAVSAHAQFNLAGDWNEAAPGSGKLSARLALNTTALGTDLGSAASKDMYLVLWGTPPAGDAMLVFQIRVLVQNIAVEPGATTPPDEETYLTAETLGLVIEQFTEAGVKKVRIKNSDGVTVAVFGE